LGMNGDGIDDREWEWNRGNGRDLLCQKLSPHISTYNEVKPRINKRRSYVSQITRMTKTLTAWSERKHIPRNQLFAYTALKLERVKMYAARTYA